jgi:putative ABC transport system permease protein
MNVGPTIKVAFRALRRNRVRSALTSLGIIIGTAAVIAVLSVGQGAAVMIQSQIGSMGSNLLLIFPGSMSMGGVHSGSGGQQSLTVADGETIERECPNINALSPLIRTGNQVVYGNNNWSTSIQGVTPAFSRARNWPVSSGDYFTDADVRTGARVCVIGATIVTQLFLDENPVGQSIRIRNMPFRVIGVLEPKGSTAWGQDQDDTIVMPWTTVRRVLQRSPFSNVNQLLVSVASADDVAPATSTIRAILRQRHRQREGVDDDFTIKDMTEITKTITSVSSLMTLLLGVIASISLIVGGIGIMNIMLVSVTERTREIGIRMAVGARQHDIMLQFLVEALALSLLGGLIGAVLGALAASVVSRINHWPVLVSAQSIGLALFVSSAIGIFFGFYPAWRAARLNPIDCLRHE